MNLMQNGLKQAIDTLQNCIADYVIGDFCVGKYCPQEDACKNDDCPFEKAIDIIINLIDKQQKEIEIKDKVIDKMTDSMYNRPAYINLPYMKTKEEIKEYFYKEIENG